MRSLLPLVAVLGLLSPAEAATRKGVQAVLLPMWSTESVDRLAQTIIESGVREVEIAFWANCSSSHDEYANARRLLNALRGRVAVTLRVYLDFHATDQQSLAGLRAAAKRLSSFARDYEGPNITWKVSPSLEDNYSSGSVFETRAHEVLRHLPPAIIPRTTAVRSVVENASIPPDISFKSTFDGKTRKVVVKREIHGSPRQGYHAYSNDGRFVASHKRPEDAPACVGSDLTLSAFNSLSREFNGSVLLWRPSYNLWPCRRLSNGTYRYTKVPQHLRRDGSTMDDGKIDAFPDHERRVLLKFLSEG